MRDFLGSPSELEFSLRSPGKFLFEKEVSRGTSGGRSLAHVTRPHEWRISMAYEKNLCEVKQNTAYT
jgi:hypothetical protein